MAKQLQNIFVPGIDEIAQTYVIESWHVSQSIDALTGADAYDLTISGSLVVDGPLSALYGVTGSIQGTASYADQAKSASYAISTSYAATASYAANAATQSLNQLLTATPTTSASITFTATNVVVGSASINSDGAANLLVTASYNGEAHTYFEVNALDGYIRQQFRDEANFINYSDNVEFYQPIPTKIVTLNYDEGGFIHETYISQSPDYIILSSSYATAVSGTFSLPGVRNFANDAAAAAAGIPINGIYRNGNVLSIRIS